MPTGADTTTRGGTAVRRRLPFVLPAVGLLAMVVLPLALLVAGHWSPLLRLDVVVTTRLHDLALDNAWLDGWASVITAGGTSWVRFALLVPLLAWFVWRRDWPLAAFVGSAALLIAPVTTGLKELVGRTRPEVSDPGETLHSLSYPSGHSSGIAVTVTVLLVLTWPVLSRRGRWIAGGCGAVVIALVALTRLLLGVHFLSDVAAGVSLGVAWVLLMAGLLGVPGPRSSGSGDREYYRTHVRVTDD